MKQDTRFPFFHFLLLCLTLLPLPRLSAQQAAEFTPPFEPGDILVYDVDPQYSPNHNLSTFIVSTGPGNFLFPDKVSVYNDWRYYPFQNHFQSEDNSVRHRFTVDSEGMVLHEGSSGGLPYQLYPAFVPRGHVTLNGDIWNVPRLLDTTVLGVQTHGFELERNGLRRIVTERFGETVMIWNGNVIMALSSAVVRDTAFNRNAVRRNYLPLCGGNRYVYHYFYGGHFQNEQLTRVTETTKIDGSTWHHLEGEGPLLGWFRSDTSGVFTYEDGQERLLIASDVSLGSRYGLSMIIDTGMTMPFPNELDSFFQVQTLAFDSDYRFYNNWLADFGLYQDDAQSVWSDSRRYTFIWGVICGKELGVIVDVDRTQSAAVSATMDDIFPNPASQLVTAAFTLPRAMEAEFLLTDMLGRNVRRLDAAEYPAGSHRSMLSLEGLPPGLYLLTLRTPSVSITRRVVVSP